MCMKDKLAGEKWLYDGPGKDLSTVVHGTRGSDDRLDVGMLLQRVHALFLAQVEADALLYHMVNLNHQSTYKASKQ